MPFHSILGLGRTVRLCGASTAGSDGRIVLQKEMERKVQLVDPEEMRIHVDLGPTSQRRTQIIELTKPSSMTPSRSLRRHNNPFILLERAMRVCTYLYL